MKSSRTILRLTISVVLACALVGFAFASASYAFGKRKDVRTRIGQNVKQALDAVKATAQQRADVEKAISDVLRTAEDAFGGTQGMPDVDDILNIFQRDQIDTRAVAAIKSRREARHTKLADALTQAFYDVHDALSVEQRQQLTDYARGKVEGKHIRAFKQRLIDGFMNATIEDMLDQLDAAASEREAAHAARDEVIGSIRQAQMTQQASLERLSGLFRDDAVDKAELARFRTEKEAQLRTVTDAFEHAIARVHAGFSAPHRQKLVEIVRARRAHPPAHSAGGHDDGF